MSKKIKIFLVIFAFLVVAVVIIIQSMASATIQPMIWATAAVNRNSIYALTEDGTLHAIGNNTVRLLDNIARIESGNGHHLAVDNEGVLWTWGRNRTGELGDGTATDRDVPRPIMENVIMAAGGGSHSMAITNDNTLWMWGNNSSYQLGTGTRDFSYVPIPVLENVIDVAGGNGFTVAITKDGILKGWGSMRTPIADEPTAIMDNVIQVTAGAERFLAITSDGQLWGMGLESGGWLGLGVATDRIATSGFRIAHEPTKIMDDVIFTAAGPFRSYAITSDNTLWIWGQDISHSPIQIMSDVTFVSGRGNLAITTDGVLWDIAEHDNPQPVIFTSKGNFGKDSDYDDGDDGDEFPHGDFYPVSIGEPIDSMDFVAHYHSNFGAGHGMNIANMFDDSFFAENFLVVFEFEQPTTALGYSVAGVRANGDIILRRRPPVGAGTAISQWTIAIELNNDFVPDSFKVFFDEERTGNGRESSIPVQIIRREGTPQNITTRQDSVIPREFVGEVNRPVRILNNVRKFYHSSPIYVINNTGSLWAWSNNHMTVSAKSVWLMDNAHEILDRHSVIDTNGTLWRWDWRKRTISPVMNNVRWADGETVITKDDVLWTWGENKYGQVGDGTNTDRHSPVRIMENVREASRSRNAASAITNDGVLWVWGHNNFGQLGDGTTDDHNSPVKIADNVREVFQDNERLMYVTGDGSLSRLFGRAHSSTLIPARVSMIDNNIIRGRGWELKNVANCFVHSNWRSNSYFALTHNNKLMAWGNNTGGILGDGTTIYRNEPVQIMRNVADVFMGDNYIMVLKRDSTLWAWGINTRGQLGDGSNINRRKPVRIMRNVAEVSVRFNTNIALTKKGELWVWGSNIAGQYLSVESTTMFRANNSPRNHRPMFYQE